MKFPLTHLPTVLLLIGYPVYWLELFFFKHPTGNTTWLASGLFVAVVIFYLWQHRSDIRLPVLVGWFDWSVVILVGGMILIASAASLLPPHLMQESDVINYHITFPRQHLIAGSFAFLPWSSVDLFLLPLDFALAPYWLATEWPNKWPQLFFMLGLLAVTVRLTLRLSGGSRRSAILALAALAALHSFGIQVGTAMLDIAVCYLFFAAVESFLAGSLLLAAVEFAFFFWSKPMLPFLMVLVMLVVAGAACLFRLRLKGVTRYSLRLTGIYFTVLSVLIAGPFMAKSIAVAKTPLFPVTAAVIGEEKCSAVNFQQLSMIDQNACKWKAVKDNYGHGRSFEAFIKHFWLVAVPEKGVNNSFDYPLGLVYLLFFFPFVLLFFRKDLDRWILLLGFFVGTYWLLWFFSVQQSRFLFIPLVGMIIAVAVSMEKPSRIFLGCVLFSLALTVLSVVRAHAQDFGRSPAAVLMPRDKALVDQAGSVKAGEVVELSFPDLAFASFPVNVRHASSLFVIER